MTWDGHRFYIHIYYDSFKAALDEKKFDHILYCEAYDLTLTYFRGYCWI